MSYSRVASLKNCISEVQNFGNIQLSPMYMSFSCLCPITSCITTLYMHIPYTCTQTKFGEIKKTGNNLDTFGSTKVI